MITISQSDSIEKCTVGSTYLFIHYSKGVMLVEQTSLNNFCQSNNAPNNLPGEYLITTCCKAVFRIKLAEYFINHFNS